MASIKLRGDTSGELVIEAPAVAGTNTLSLPATTQTLATQNSLGVRNRIINGDMRIDQRNAGASLTITANPQYTLDRWFAGVNNVSKISVQQSSTVPTGFTNSMLVTSLAATTPGTNDLYYIQQSIEGYNIADLDFGLATAKTITISFWVRSSLTGTFGAVLLNAGSNRSFPFNYTISTANTWTQISQTITGDITGTWFTNNITGFQLRFGLGAGSTYQGVAGAWGTTNAVTTTTATNIVATNGATWYITGVQLEVGTEATPFEHRPYDMELARCQRYYELINDNNYSSYGVMAGGTSQGFAGYVDYKITKRATPTITITGSFLIQGNSNQPGTTSMGTSGIGKRAVYINGTGTGSNVTNGFAYNLLDVNGYIKVDAEL